MVVFAIKGCCLVLGGEFKCPWGGCWSCWSCCCVDDEDEDDGDCCLPGCAPLVVDEAEVEGLVVKLVEYPRYGYILLNMPFLG